VAPNIWVFSLERRSNDAQPQITRKIKEKEIKGKGQSGGEKQIGHTHNF